MAESHHRRGFAGNAGRLKRPTTPNASSAPYTFSAPVLQRFNAVVPHGERSRVMEGLMKQALAAREAELERLADAFMTDPAFAECRDDEMLWEATSADGVDSVA